MNQIIDWIKTIGIWGIIALLAYVVQAAQPLIKPLIGSIKNKKARDGIAIANQYATTAVTTIASFTNLSNPERKSKAISIVTAKLTKRGINISGGEVSKIVESCYQYAKGHGNLVDKQPKQTSNTDPQANNQANQVNSVLNPQPVSNQQSNSQQGSSDDKKAKELAQQVQNNPKAQSLLKGMNGNGQSN